MKFLDKFILHKKNLDNLSKWFGGYQLRAYANVSEFLNTPFLFLFLYNYIYRLLKIVINCNITFAKN